MELSPDDLYAAAHRWDALASDLADAGASLHGVPVGGLGDAAGEAALLLDTVESSVARLCADTERLVDGLLLTVRAVADAEDAAVSGVHRPHDLP